MNVQCDGCQELVEPEPPANRRKYGLLGAVFIGLIGLGIGGTIGIATAGLGMPATIPLALIGAYVGWKVGTLIAKKQDGVTCPECNHNFGGSVL